MIVFQNGSQCLATCYRVVYHTGKLVLGLICPKVRLVSTDCVNGPSANSLFVSHQVEADRNELHARVTSLRNMVSNVEDQLKQTSAQLSMAKDSILELEAEVNKVQLTADQAQRTAEDMERRLNRRAGELQASEEKCTQLERRIGDCFLAALSEVSSL